MKTNSTLQVWSSGLLADVVITLSIGVPVLMLLDQLLSERQKTALNMSVLRAWNILDELKSWPIIGWLSGNRMRWLIAILITIALFLPMIFLASFADGMPDGTSSAIIYYIRYIVGMAFFALLCRLTLAVILRPSTRWKMIGRAAVICTAGILLYALSIYLIVTTEHQVGNSPSVLMYGVGILLVPAFVTILSGITILLLIGLVYVASALLFSAEFLVRRIAEYPKGPILALSAIVGCVVAILKAVWG